MRSSTPTPPRRDRERALLRRLLVGGLAAGVALAAVAASAAELRGRVTAVTGRDVQIQIEGDLLPRVGDPVMLAFPLPGGPEVRVAGAWKVTSIEGARVGASPVGEGSTPAVGQSARIDSPSPVSRTGTPGPSTAVRPEASGPSTRLAPGAPGAPRAPGPASPPASSGVAPGGRSWLGVEIQTLTPEAAETLGIPTAQGAVVVRAVPGSPAEGSGLVPADVIVRFDGAAVRNAPELQRRVADTAVGATVELVVIRAGAEQILRVTIGARPSEQ
jgi:hypothetical protein